MTEAEPQPGIANSLEEFVAEHAQKPGEGTWQLESPKMLEIGLSNGRVFTKLGAMVAYYGDLKFERAGVGGLGKFVKSALTSESGRATQVTGSGTLYVADSGKEITVLHLTDDVLYVNSSDLLAYSDTLEWDIVITKGAGMFAGGLFSFKLSGTGYCAITTHGKPLVLGVNPQYPLFTDPNATVAWSEGLQVSVKTDVNLKTLTGRTSGETIQLAFTGNGFVVMQPYEEVPITQSAG